MKVQWKWSVSPYVSFEIYADKTNTVHLQQIFLWNVLVLVWVILLNEAIMEFVFTERGARKLISNGYQYVKQNDLGNGLTPLECIKLGNG